MTSNQALFSCRNLMSANRYGRYAQDFNCNHFKYCRVSVALRERLPSFETARGEPSQPGMFAVEMRCLSLMGNKMGSNSASIIILSWNMYGILENIRADYFELRNVWDAADAAHLLNTRRRKSGSGDIWRMWETLRQQPVGLRLPLEVFLPSK